VPMQPGGTMLRKTEDRERMMMNPNKETRPTPKRRAKELVKGKGKALCERKGYSASTVRKGTILTSAHIERNLGK
jgi:hypothetical protein